MEAIIKNTQEQAVAAWIGYQRQLRIDAMILRLFKQDENLESALDALRKAKSLIAEEIVERNRGGGKGMHGFIAEVGEVGIGNARKLVQGEQASYVWVNNNKAADLIRDGTEIQQKFVRSGGHWGLESIRKHLADYPDFLKNGGKYQIPKDFYNSLVTLYEMSPEQAARLPTHGGDGQLTYAKWKWVQEFFDQMKRTDPEMDISKIEASLIDYSDAQSHKIGGTLSKEERQIEDTDQKIRQGILEKGKPTLKEGVAATAVSAVTEGGMAFCLSVAKKRREGKRFSDFEIDDWVEVGIETGKGSLKGGVRGAGIYALTNFTATPSNVACAFMTAVFGVTAQANALRKNQISKEDFLINSETICLDVSVSAVSSLIGQTLIPAIGQTLIPVPVLGAIIGNLAGMFMYDIAKNCGLEKEQRLISGYCAEIEALNEKLDAQYEQLIQLLNKKLKEFKSLMEFAFDEDVNKAFAESIEFARLNGVDEKKILKTKSDIDIYFDAKENTYEYRQS